MKFGQVVGVRSHYTPILESYRSFQEEVLASTGPSFVLSFSLQPRYKALRAVLSIVIHMLHTREQS